MLFRVLSIYNLFDISKKCFWESKKCDLCICEKFFLQERTQMFCSLNVMSLFESASIEVNLLWSIWKIEKITFFFLSTCCDAFFILGKNPAESQLMIESPKYSVMIICCCYLPSICYIVLLYIILRTLPEFVYNQPHFYKYQSFLNFVANVF